MLIFYWFFNDFAYDASMLHQQLTPPGVEPGTAGFSSRRPCPLGYRTEGENIGKTKVFSSSDLELQMDILGMH